MYCKIDARLIWLLPVVSIMFVVTCSSPENDSTVLPDEGQIHVPEGYTVEVVADSSLVDYPMFATLDRRGRLFVFESVGNIYEESKDAIDTPQYHIKLLEDENNDGFYDKSTIFADSVGFPQGGTFYNGSLYASSAPDLLKFTDTDGDGMADKRETMLSGWTLNINANSLVGPFMGPDGWLYMTSAIEGFDVTTKQGERLEGETSRIWRVQPDGSDLEWVAAGGMNNPVELTFTEAGEPIGTETYFTNPKAGQRDALVYWVKGGVYPKPNTNIQRDSLVRTGELMPVVSKYSRVAPSGITRYRGTRLGNDFKDNLFSAQFNTHRVLRHQLFRDGASFRTEDEIFFSSDNEDFHPTDVLEDADGSLLVVNTGGWFIKGCPLSQVAKPELKGAIYRVRKKGADQGEDPYGDQIQWASLPPEKAITYIDDQRPFVSDRAVEWLVGQGAEGAELLKQVLQTSNSSDARTKAVFALYRIGTDNARASVRSALEDEDQQVQVAAARSVGLAADTQAVNKLVEMVQKTDPAARRQAAIALAQIKDPRSVSALLEAGKDTEDRFSKHAIIFALISVDRPKLVEQGLTHSSPEVQQAAMIALDQMPSSSLQAEQIIPFLTGNNSALQRTALWLASRHPEWSADMTTFLRSRFRDESFAQDERDLYVDMLVSFCGDDRIQQFMADEMQQGSTERNLLLMDAMGTCSIEEFPQVWVERLKDQLHATNDSDVQDRALALVRLREIASLAPQLQEIGNKENEAPAVRIKALSVLTAFQDKLADQQFHFLYDQLQAENNASVRQQAATVMADSKLTEAQLVQVGEYLKQTDALLPRLIPVFKGAYSKEIGHDLISTLMGSESLNNFTEENLRELFNKYPPEINPHVDQLIRKLRQAKAGRLERIQRLERQISHGDIERGRKLFFGKGTCSTCHSIGDEGGTFAPDLTSIQKDRTAHDILEAIIYPSASLVREYETYRIKTTEKEYTGIIQRQTQDEIILGISRENSVRISQDEIVSTEMLDGSMMPPGLDRLLSDQEMADLMTFLLGQDQNADIDEKYLR